MQTEIADSFSPVPVAFNDYGAAEFNDWLSQYADYDVTPTTVGYYFDQIAKFEGGDTIAHIELGSHESQTHKPEVFDVTRQMVQWSDDAETY